jgi:hypothetical protein
MRYAELENDRVRHIGGEPEYTVLPPNCVEIPEGIEVYEGQIYDGDSFREMTNDEIEAIYRPVFDAERNRLFSATEWVRQRHADRVEMGIDDEVNWNSWLDWWQALRDMPEAEGFDPRSPEWPSLPNE